MGLTLTREKSTGGIPIFQQVPENAQGGYVLDATGLTAGVLVPAGTVMGASDSTRLAKPLKVAQVYENAISSATAIKVLKGQLFIVGDYVAKTVGGAAYAITAIDQTNAAYDLLTVGTTLGVALSAANQLIITDTLKLAATVPAGNATVKLVGTGSGRMIISKSCANLAITKNFIHCYYGKKGAIDLVVQDLKEVDMRPTADRRGTNVFSSYLAGIKTFADGAKKFLDVQIAV